MKRDLPSECGGCGSEERWFLHHVRLRGIYRRLCTSCVLKLHAGLFCPICVEVYEGSSLPVNRVMCLRCPSVTHRDCVSKDVVSSYVCPPCSNPSFTFFDSTKGGDSVPSGNSGRIDVKLAKVLVAAAQIASTSMHTAASIARIDADKRVKEAALARKRAREALERFSSLSSKDKKSKETMIVEQVPNSVVREEQKKNFKGNTALAAAVVAQKRFETQYSAEANDKCGRVATSSNNSVGMKEDRLDGSQPPSVLQQPPRCVASVENRDIVEGSSTSVKNNQLLQNPTTVDDKKSSESPHVQNDAVLHEKGKTDLFPIPTASGNCQIPQPNQDALVKDFNEGVILTGSSNTAS